VSGETLPRDALIRFVVGPDDVVVPDLAERLPGRGLWLCARRDIVAAACSRNLFSRAARRKVAPMTGPQGETLERVVEDQLARRCVDLVSLARRAGVAVAGFDQVRHWLRARPARTGDLPALLLTASDAARDGRDKLAALARHGDDSVVPVVHRTPLTAHELGQAFGRDHIVHVLIAPHRLAERLMKETGRLAGFRGGDLRDATGAPAAAAAGPADEGSD
jgi:hypothetical protein